MPTERTPVTIDIQGLQALVDVLVEQGNEVFGPQVINDVIAIRPLTSVDQLPAGWTDDQGAGRYRLHYDGSQGRFGYAVGPQAWKPLLHQPRLRALSMTQSHADDPVEVHVTATPRRRRAFLGVRPCELEAIAKLDTVLLQGANVDRAYHSARSDLMLIVVNCTVPAPTCFCTSMNSGPRVSESVTIHDLEITELVTEHDEGPRYVVTPASRQGAEILDVLGSRTSAAAMTNQDALDIEAGFRRAESAIERHVDTKELHDVMIASSENALWAQLADRCIACGNCTAVCPTCFCTGVDDITDLAGTTTERWRHWDSCFSLEFSRLGSAPVRSSVASRYRHWLTHKLGTWHDQFDESGCVGCGRCITWCPVGIDLTAEIPTLRTAALSGGDSRPASGDQ
jgi:sulfhydrogenase subunit beta (sulfur reductase)